MCADRLSIRAQLSFAGFELTVDEQIDLGSVTVLFGPSGSGKSTLLRAIAGFETPSRGRIAMGQDVWFDSDARVELVPHQRPVGLMFQDARLFAHLDVAGNLDFAEKRSRERDTGFGRDEIVNALDLAPLLGRGVDALSGGERQRVALGRTLLTRPKLLLLDEPLAALDHERKAEILPYLEQLHGRFDIPTIYVSHSVEEVGRLADRVVVLTEGRVQAHGPAAEIFERLDLQPITGRFEAGALIDARVAEHDRQFDLTRVEIDGETVTLPLVEHLDPGEIVRLRIRARDVAVATQRPEGISIRNILPATIAQIVPEPDTAFAEVFLRLREHRIRARLTRASVADLGLAEGMSVYALIKTVGLDRRALWTE
ncbi:MAG: molybdenum ABC transporter ATP-binding protein [bacterium]|nr:molybdenum ABC transporter ATP-binding protein [bacterium]